MDKIEAKEKFSFNLLHPENRAFNITVLFMVYKTIEHNQSITLNQLKWLLNSEYMLQHKVVEGAVASLTSKNLFNSVSRWQPPRSSASSPKVVHLRTRPGDEFKTWLDKTLRDHPELEIFSPPKFVPANNENPATTKTQ